MEAQNVAKLKSISQISSLLTFQGRQMPTTSILEYHTGLGTDRTARVHRIIQELNGTSIKETHDLLGAYRNFKDIKNVYAIRRIKGQHRLFTLLVNSCFQEGIIPLLIMDEAQIAIGQGQVADRTLGSSGMNEQNEGDLAVIRKLQEDERVAKKALKTFYGMVAENKKSAMFVAVSATNIAHSLDDYHTGKRPVILHTGEGYCGYHFIDGFQICDPSDVVPPKVMPVSQFGNEIGVKELTDLDLRAFTSPRALLELHVMRDFETFAKEHHMAVGGKPPQYKSGTARNHLVQMLFSDYRPIADRVRRIRLSRVAKYLGYEAALDFFNPSHRKKHRKDIIQRYAQSPAFQSVFQKYQISCRRAIGKMIQYLLITDNPQKKKGLLLRWEINDLKVKEFLEPLKKDFKNEVRFIYYSGDQVARETAVSSFLEENNPPDDKGNILPYVLVVTGLGRYGETYPADCGYAYDATSKNYSGSSFDQSLLGRMRGYGKYNLDDPEGTRPLVVLSDNAYHDVFIPWYNGNGLLPKGKVDRYVDKATGTSIPTSPKYCFVPRPQGQGPLSALFYALKDFLIKAGVSQQDVIDRKAKAKKQGINPDRIGSKTAHNKNMPNLYSILNANRPGTCETWLEFIEKNLHEVNPLKYLKGETAQILRYNQDGNDGESDIYKEAHTGSPYAFFKDNGNLKYGLRLEINYNLSDQYEIRPDLTSRDVRRVSAVKLNAPTEGIQSFTPQISYYFPEGQEEPEVCQIVLPFSKTPTGRSTAARLRELVPSAGSVAANFAKLHAERGE